MMVDSGAGEWAATPLLEQQATVSQDTGKARPDSESGDPGQGSARAPATESARVSAPVSRRRP